MLEFRGCIVSNAHTNFSFNKIYRVCPQQDQNSKANLFYKISSQNLQFFRYMRFEFLIYLFCLCYHTSATGFLKQLRNCLTTPLDWYYFSLQLGPMSIFQIAITGDT